MNHAYIGVSAAVVLANGVEVTLICKAIKKIKPCEQWLFSLSVADLLVGMSLMSWKTLKVNDVIVSGNEEMNDSMASLAFYLSILASVCHVGGMTFDRLYAVIKPLEHRVKVTKKFNIKILLAVWFACFAVLLPVALLSEQSNLKYAVAYTIPVVSCLMLMTYGFIVYRSTLYRRKHLTAAQMQSGAAQWKNERRLVIMCLAITLSFCSLNMPYSCRVMMGQDTSYTKLLLLCNSITNPMIYFFWKIVEKRMKKKATTSHVTAAAKGSTDTLDSKV
eukprot:gene10822-11974_t